jgi:hypothetical protein
VNLERKEMEICKDIYELEWLKGPSSTSSQKRVKESSIFAVEDD